MGQITVDPGAATTDERAGPAFAYALAARDFDKLQSLLDPEVEFRALTPRSTRRRSTCFATGSTRPQSSSRSTWSTLTWSATGSISSTGSRAMTMRPRL